MANAIFTMRDITGTHAMMAFDEEPGIILLGGFFQCFLQGIIVVQAARYWESHHDDSRLRRFFVAVLVILSLLQTGIEDYKVWRVTIMQLPWATSGMPWFNLFLNGFICSLCKLYLLKRCWEIMNKNWWIIALLLPLAITTIVANALIAVTVAQVSRNPQQVKIDTTFVTGVVAFSYWTSASVVLDMVLSIILMIFLWRARTGLWYLDRALFGFFAIATESAAWPPVSMIVAVSLYNSRSAANNRLVFFFLLLTGKLYILALLRTLNARSRLRMRLKSHDIGRVSLGDWSWDQTNAEPPTLTESIIGTIDPSIGPLDATSRQDLASEASPGDIHYDTPRMNAREYGVH